MDKFFLLKTSGHHFLLGNGKLENKLVDLSSYGIFVNKNIRIYSGC